MSKYLKYGLLFARIILGLTFLFSGFVKAVDPLGSVYKFSEYFLAFGWSVSENLVQLLSLVQSSLEFSLGVILIFSVWNKIAKWAVFLFMLFMTPFTLYLALVNPVTDCGCFGDVLVITNWQTFLKNVFLLLLSVSLLVGKESVYTVFGERSSRWTILWSIVFSILLSVFAYRHLPLVDFSPYKIGNDLKVLTSLPPNAVADSFDYKFVYEKEGVRTSFSVNAIPADSLGWKYVERDLILIRKGDSPVIKDLIIEHPQMGNITEDLLNNSSYVFLMISPKLETAERDFIENINKAWDYANKYGYVFYGITSSNVSAIDEWSYEYNSGYDFCSSDDKKMQAMLRANPGLMILKNGVVLHKWASRDIPDFGKINSPLDLTDLGKARKFNILKVLVFLFISFVVPLVFFYLLHTGHKIHIKIRMKKKSKQNNQV